jgi:hypothetical protein
MKRFARSLILAAILVTAGCGSDQAPTPTAQVAAPIMVAKTSMSAGNAIIPVEPVPTVDLNGGTPIADNFNTADGIAPSPWGMPPSSGVDPVGAFRMICGAGQVSYDDPIVYPGQPGASHLHQFYGNLGANANSTYSSLRTTGNSTCGDPNNPAAVNRSGYWMPAMLDGAGHVVKPMYVTIYYKRIPASDPRCTRSNPGSVGDCVGIPTGLRWITGYNMQGGANDTQTSFFCQDSDDGTVKTLSSDQKTNITDVIPICPIGARLTLLIAGPDCWDGKNLDSADHRSHVSHSAYVWDAALNQSYDRCDDAHPYHMPKITIQAFYTVDANFAANKWHLSSDEMVPGAPSGTTFHADYFEAWSPTVRNTWQTDCIDAHMSCAGGDLGNGTVIKGMTASNTQALIDLSSISSSTTTVTTQNPAPTPSSPTTTTVAPSPPCSGKGKKRCV